MDLPHPESVSIKVEPWSQEEGGGEIPYTDSEIYLPDVKKEGLQYAASTPTISSSNVEAVPVKAEPGPREEVNIDHPDIKKEYPERPEIITQKAGRKDTVAARKMRLYRQRLREKALGKSIGGTDSSMKRPRALTSTERSKLHYQRKKQQRLSQNNNSSINADTVMISMITVETVTNKAEPGPIKEDGGAIPLAEIDIDLLDVKKECFEHSKSITQITADMITDLKMHPEGKPYSCSHCNYSSSYKPALTRHLRTHTEIKPYSCSYCNYSCRDKSRLTVHLRSHTGEKPYACSQCNYTCSYKSAITGHLRTHTGIKPYSCSYCNYSCRDKSRLTIHLRTHTGEKPYPCSNCNYSCSNKAALIVHLRTHTGLKPYSCSYCSYSCSQSGRLKCHILTHTGEKPHSCSHCNYCCLKKSDLTRHLRTHTGEKPHSCSHCNYSCSRKSHLSVHLLTHTVENLIHVPIVTAPAHASII